MTATRILNLGSRKRAAAVLVVLVAAGCILRFAGLTEHSLWYDEGVTLTFSEGGSAAEVLDELARTQSSERYQPLYFLLLYLWRELFGSSEWTLRSFSSLLGSLALIVFALSTKCFLVGPGRIVSVAFMSISSFAIYYSQEARPYSLLLLLCVMHWYLTGRFFHSVSAAERRRWWLATALVGFLGGLSSLFFSCYVVSVGAAWLATGQKRSREWSFWLVSGLALVPSLLFFAFAGANGGEESAVVSRTDRPMLFNAAFAVYGLLVGVTYGPPVDALRLGSASAVLGESWRSLLVFVVVCIGLLGSGVVGMRMARRREWGQERRFIRYVLVSLIFGLLVLVAFAWTTSLNWLPRHSTFLFPSLVLSLGWIWRSGSGAWQRIARWSVIALLVLNAWSLKHYYSDRVHYRGDYRSVAELLRNQQPMPIVLLLGSPRLLEYYEAPRFLDVRWKEDWEKVRLIQGYTEGAERFLVVINREDLLVGRLEGFEELVRPVAELEESWVLPAFRVAKFARADRAGKERSG